MAEGAMAEGAQAAIAWGTGALADPELPESPAMDERKALIEEGRRRMEAYRRRTGSGSSTPLKGAESMPCEVEEHTPQRDEAPFTPVARGLKKELDKLKRDELDLARVEWSEQRHRMAGMRAMYEEQCKDAEDRASEASAEVQQLRESLAAAEAAQREWQLERAKVADRVESATAALQQERDKNEQLRLKCELLSSELEERIAGKQAERESEVAALEAQLEVQMRSIQRLEADKEEMQAKLREHEDKAREQTVSLVKATEELGEATQGRAALERTLEERTAALARLKQERDALSAQLQASDRAQSAGHEALRAKLTEAERAHREQQMAAMDAKENLALTMEENKALKERLEKVRKERAAQSGTLAADLAATRDELETAQQRAEVQLRHARDDAARERAAAEAAREELRTMQEEARQWVAEKHELEGKIGVLRETLTSKSDMLRFLEDKLEQKTAKLGDDTSALAGLRQARDEARSDARILRDKVDHLKRSIAERDEVLSREKAVRRELEGALREAQKSHAKQLREQSAKFVEHMHAQQGSERALHDHARQDQEHDHDVLAGVERDLFALREKMRADLVLPSEEGPQGGDGRSRTVAGITGEQVAALLERVAALEHANEQLREESRHEDSKPACATPWSKRLIAEQAQTIHQLTLEVERGHRSHEVLRGRLDRSGLCEPVMASDRSADGRDDAADDFSGGPFYRSEVLSEENGFVRPRPGRARPATDAESTASSAAPCDLSGPEAESMQEKLEQARREHRAEAEARKKAEEKVVFLQSEFTDLFVQYFGKAKERELERRKKKAGGLRRKRRSRSATRTGVTRGRSASQVSRGRQAAKAEDAR